MRSSRCPPSLGWCWLGSVWKKDSVRCSSRGPNIDQRTDGKTDRRTVIQVPPFLNFTEMGDKNVVCIFQLIFLFADQTPLKNIVSTQSNDFMMPLPSSLSLSFSPEKEIYRFDRPLSPKDFSTTERPAAPKTSHDTKGSKDVAKTVQYIARTSS